MALDDTKSRDYGSFDAWIGEYDLLDVEVNPNEVRGYLVEQINEDSRLGQLKHDYLVLTDDLVLLVPLVSESEDLSEMEDVLEANGVEPERVLEYDRSQLSGWYGLDQEEIDQMENGLYEPVSELEDPVPAAAD